MGKQTSRNGRRGNRGSSRSRKCIRPLTRGELNERDLEIINRQARRLNREAADVLAYQTLPLKISLDIPD